MAESRKKVIQIHEVDPEDMEIILKYIYGTLHTIPEAGLQSLFLATDRLQVWCSLAPLCYSLVKHALSYQIYRTYPLLMLFHLQCTADALTLLRPTCSEALRLRC